MKWKGVQALLMVCLIIVGSVMALAQQDTRQGLGPVHNLDKDTYYSSIQAGIDDADDGNTIQVSEGVYYENLVINKTLTIRGENNTSTFIDGDNEGDVVLISNDWVNISGFTIRNSGPNWISNPDSGLKINGAINCSISNNTFTQNKVGISIVSSFSSGNSSLIEIWNRSGSYPQINNVGQAAWKGHNESGNNHILFWDGQSTNYLTDDYYVDMVEPKINDMGQVVWQGSKYTHTDMDGDIWTIWGEEWEIYLWDGHEEIQITDNDFEDEDPDINDLGQIVWKNDGGIFLWDNGVITKINDSGISPKINNNGHIAWIEGDRIFFYDGATTVQINHTIEVAHNSPSHLELSNIGHLVWDQTIDNDSEVFYWDGINTFQLTYNSVHDMFPKINDNDQIVWIEGGFEGNIMFWDEHNTVQITDTNMAERPKINGLGHVTWQGFSSGEVYYWNGTAIQILTVGNLLGRDPSINENNQVVWTSNIDDGIYLWNGGSISANFATHNIISNNTIMGNEHGIRIETAYDNMIYHNLFINNSNQSYCRQPNDWDMGYPKGGNYWSDYSGIDEKSGPNQDEEGSDGIGDEPYIIEGGGYVDHYPMMSVSSSPGTIVMPPSNLPGNDSGGVDLAPIIFGSAIAVGIGVGLSLEIVGYSILVVLLALYSKIKKEEVLDQYLRGKIHGYIIANPGDHYNAIKKALDINNGSLAHHLSVLEREELIKARNAGAYKRFYPYSYNLSNGGTENLTEVQERIGKLVKENPGVTQKELASLLGVSTSTINYNIEKMVGCSIIQKKKHGLKVKYYYLDGIKD